MRFRMTAFFFLWSLVTQESAFAQVCFGNASFAQSSTHVGAIFDGAESFTTFGGQALFGAGRTGLFVGAIVAGRNVDGLDGTGALVQGSVGVDVAVDQAKRVYVCPVGSVFYQSGPDLGSINLSAVGFTGGGNIGFVAHESAGGIRTILTAGIAGIHQSFTFEVAGDKTSQSQNSGAATVGLGFVFKRVYLIPSVQIPLGLDDEDPSFNVGFGLVF